MNEQKKNGFLYFALRNAKLQGGLAVVVFFLVLSFAGPGLARNGPFDCVSPGGAEPPSSEYWFGTTFFGQDMFAQFAYGLRATFLVGIIGGGLGTLVGVLVGFTAGYRGGIADEILNVLTNIVLIVPTLAVLLIIVAYLEVRSLLAECVFIGLTAWPWAARAIRARTFSLRTREFIDLARMTGRSSLSIISTEIAPYMLSYLLMTFILQFGGAILNAAALDFIGLGPTNAISLGLMMQVAVLWGGLRLGSWWCFVPPGLAITAIVGALYIMNVGLDEVFSARFGDL